VQGVTCEHEPTSFAGYKIERSAERDVATISMPELIEQKFKQECPELVSAAARAAFKLQHVKGETTWKVGPSALASSERRILLPRTDLSASHDLRLSSSHASRFGDALT
jgi:hypothetical protein